MTGIYRFFLAFLIVGAVSLTGCSSTSSWPGQKPPQQTAATQSPSPLKGPKPLPDVFRPIQTPNTQTIGNQLPSYPPLAPEQNIPVAPLQPSAKTGPVKVAILLPLSGPKASLGQAMLQAAQLAVFEIGFENFELMPRDTQGTPQGAVAAASSALDDGAQLVLGPLLSETTLAAKSVTQRRGVNMISFSTDEQSAGENTYLIGFLPYDQVQRIARFAAKQNIRRVGIIAPRDKYGDLVVQAFLQSAQKLGLTITEQMRFMPGDSNASITAQMKNFTHYDERQLALEQTGNPGSLPFEAVFMPTGGSQAQILGNSLSYYGLPPKTVRRLGTGLWDDPALAGEAGLQGGWFAAPSPAGRQGFESRYRATYKQAPPRIASLAYDATALAAVLARTGIERTGRPAYDKASLSSSNGFAGVDGIFRFQPNGIIERGQAILELHNGRIVEIDPAPTTFEFTSY